MLWLITAVFTWLQSFVRSRHDLGLEIVALRHQLVVLKRRTKRARLQRSDRAVLDSVTPLLAAVVQVASDGQAGNGGWVASAGFPSVLPLSLPTQNSRKAGHLGRYADLNPDHGARKLHLGRAP